MNHLPPPATPLSFSTCLSRIWVPQKKEKKNRREIESTQERKVKPFSFPHNFRRCRRTSVKNAKALAVIDGVYSIYGVYSI